MKSLMQIIFSCFAGSIFFSSVVFSQEVSENTSKDFSVGFISSIIETSNTSMPRINGIHLGYKILNFDTYLEFAKGTYKNEPSLSATAVGNEKEDQQSKYILALGLKGKFLKYLSWDLALGVNQFSYSNEGIDLTCCSQIPYKYSYDFTGVFIRPSFGAEYAFNDWTAGIRLMSWMQYLSKTVSNKVEDFNVSINPYIPSTFNDLDRDSIQSSHLIPPHLFLTYSF